MKNVKQAFFCILLASSALTTPIHANEMVNTSSISEDENDFYKYFHISKDEVDKLTEDAFQYADQAPLVSDKDQSASRTTVGTWSLRDGVICVSDAKLGPVNYGHAGIVAAAPYYNQTIEALNPSAGVQAVGGYWPSREDMQGRRIYQCGVIATSIEQDQQAAIMASQWIGKPYDWRSPLTTTDTFYCSQLVYQAYRLGAGYTLPHSTPGVIFPADLLHGGATELIYRYEP